MRAGRRFVPYIRRSHPADRSENIRVALRLELYGDDCFVLVQRGCGRNVVACARTRRELRQSFDGVLREALSRGTNWKKPTARDFRKWAARFSARHEELQRSRL